MSCPADRRPSRRAITLVELIVSMTVSAAVAGLVLGMLVHVRREVRRCQARLTMRTAARSVLDQVEAHFAAAVRPSALDVPASDFFFEPTCCAFFHSRQFQTAGFSQVTIESASTSDPGGSAIPCVLMQQSLAPDPGDPAPPAVARPRILGTTNPHLSTSVAFQYDTGDRQKDRAFDFRERLEPGQYPRYVRIRVTTEDTEGRWEPFELSAVIELL